MSVFRPKLHHLKDGREIVIRSGSGDDAVDVMEMVGRIFNESPFLLTEPDEFKVTLEQERAWIEGFIPTPNSVLLLAEHGGQLVGILDFQGGLRRRIAHSGTIGTSVRAEFRGQGIGSLLIGALIEWAKSSCLVERLDLLVFAENVQAIALYKKMGFEVEGCKKKAVRLSNGTYLDELMMGLLIK